jgi:hypothetical protein
MFAGNAHSEHFQARNFRAALAEQIPNSLLRRDCARSAQDQQAVRVDPGRDPSQRNLAHAKLATKAKTT